MEEKLQIIAICGLFLGLGLLIGGFVSAKNRMEGNNRRKDDHEHDWRTSPEGKTCFICNITRKKDRRSWVTREKEEENVVRQEDLGK